MFLQSTESLVCIIMGIVIEGLVPDAKGDIVGCSVSSRQVSVLLELLLQLLWI